MLSASRPPVGGSPGDAVGGPLETIANNSSNSAPGRVEKRRIRYADRAVLWRASSLGRVRNCGRAVRSESAGVTLRVSDQVAAVAGLQHCGSVWACPVCSSQILVHRALEIGAVLGQAVAEGYSLGFVTVTMRHRRSQALRGLWSAAGRAWGRATSGGQWVTDQGAHGVEGWVRVWEVTDGRNGWHVHVHAVVVLAPGATPASLDVVAGGMFDRWSKGLVEAGQEAPRLVGQEWHLVEGDDAAGQLSEYLFKLADQGAADRARSLGLELTHTRPGRARSDLATRPVWSLLGDLVERGEAETLRRWHEWEAGSKGRRQVGWSKGLRERFAPEVEGVEDQAVVDTERGTAADDVVHLTVQAWRQVVAVPARIPQLLEALEVGPFALCAVLDSLSIPYALLNKEEGFS
jgi:hypothetical protein